MLKSGRQEFFLEFGRQLRNLDGILNLFCTTRIIDIDIMITKVIAV